jgi:branched-chain amino acid transport system ATP-binding protein
VAVETAVAHQNVKGGATIAGRRSKTKVDVLAERRDESGEQLSCGQRQMLAIGRAVMAGPRIIVFDQSALSLAPTTVDLLYDISSGFATREPPWCLLSRTSSADFRLRTGCSCSRRGAIALCGAPDELRGDPRLEALYMGEAQADDVSAAARTREELWHRN